MIEMHALKSSNVAAIGYDQSAQELHVEFVKSGYYVYFDVGEWVFNEFLIADSPGRYHHQNIMGRYSYERR